jgi:hypothetical protein
MRRKFKGFRDKTASVASDTCAIAGAGSGGELSGIGQAERDDLAFATGRARTRAATIPAVLLIRIEGYILTCAKALLALASAATFTTTPTTTEFFKHSIL